MAHFGTCFHCFIPSCHEILRLKPKRLLKLCESLKEKTPFCNLNSAPTHTNLGDFSQMGICRSVEVARAMNLYTLANVNSLAGWHNSMLYQVRDSATRS